MWLPFLVAVYDALRSQDQQRSRRAREYESDDEDDDSPDATAYEDLSKSLSSTFLSSKWRYTFSAFLLSFGLYLVAGLWNTAESSHVCALLSTDISMIPRFQLLALFFDLALAIAVFELALGGTQSSTRLLAAPVSWAIALILTSAIWAIVTIVVYFGQPENRPWLFMQGDSSTQPLLTLLGQAIFLTTVCISTLYSVGAESIQIFLC